MYSRQVARLLWCAPSERKRCGSTLGQQELAVQRSCGSWHSGRCQSSAQHGYSMATAAAWLQQQAYCKPCMLHAACRMQSHADLALIRAMQALILELIHAIRR